MSLTSTRFVLPIKPTDFFPRHLEIPQDEGQIPSIANSKIFVERRVSGRYRLFFLSLMIGKKNSIHQSKLPLHWELKPNLELEMVVVLPEPFKPSRPTTSPFIDLKIQTINSSFFRVILCKILKL